MDEQVKRDLDFLRAQYQTLPRGDTPFTRREEMLSCPDGARLRTLIFCPKGQGPFPTVVQRSCYPHLEPLYLEHGAAYASRGFAYVCQFCRGTGGSEGKWVPNENERADGSALLQMMEDWQWVGPVGYYGSSYLAFTGWVIADILPPKVKTLYLTHYGTDRFVSAYQRGLFRQDVLTSWAFQNTGAQPRGDYLTSARYRPQARVDEDVWQVGALSWYRAWITNTNRSDAYWNQGFWKMLREIPGKVTVPVYLGESWYDHHLGSALETWKALSPQARAHSTLRIGAWNHNFHPCVEGFPCKHLDSGDALTAFSWFTRILRDGELPEPSVRCYRVGQDAWFEAGSYPFAGQARKTFSLTGAGTLTPGDAPQGEASYTYDPDDPVRSHGAESVLYCLEEAGVREQMPPNWRGDVLSFVSEPLCGMNILGKVLVELAARSSAPDTAFTAKLMEVKPDGRAYNIRSGITTLAYRESADHDRMDYQSGSRVRAALDMWDVAWRIGEGSRLRLDISSSDWPQYAAHTNTPGVWAMQEEARPARQTLYFGGEAGSRIIIPVEEEKRT